MKSIVEIFTDSGANDVPSESFQNFSILTFSRIELPPIGKVKFKNITKCNGFQKSQRKYTESESLNFEFSDQSGHLTEKVTIEKLQNKIRLINTNLVTIFFLNFFFLIRAATHIKN